MPNNERLKVIIHDAKLICRTKFKKVEEKFGADNTDVLAIKQEIKHHFAHFDNPDFWLNDISFNEQMLWHHILKINIADPADMSNFLTVTRAFLTFLNEDVIKKPAEALTNIVTSDFNLRTINALNKSNLKINGRKTFFKNQGKDLSQNTEFVTLETKHKNCHDNYKKCLKKNTIEAKQTDIIIINRFGEAISKIVTVPIFINFYKSFYKFVDGKIPVTVPATIADPPVVDSSETTTTTNPTEPVVDPVIEDPTPSPSNP